MEPIGYVPVQLIPSLDGWTNAIDKQFGGLISQGRAAGKKIGSGIADGVRASESDIKRAFDNQAKLADRAADATGRLKVAQAGYQDLVDKGITSGQRYERAKAAVEKTTRDEARATKTATDALKDYERAAKQAASAGDNVGGGLGDKLKGLAGQANSSGVEAASGFVDGFGGPIAALGTKGGPIGLALAGVAGVALGAGALIAKNVMAGMDQLQDQANVAAQLGFTPDQMKPIADAAAKAYAGNFGESIAGNMDAARAAIQSGLLRPDATAQDTQGIVERLTTVSGLLGEEIPATARAAQQAIRTGLAPDAEAAFDLIVKGQQAGINTSEDFLDTLNEYGTQFRKLGLSGPEAVGLISQAMKGGARDSDVAADALKEFSIRAIDGSKTTVDGFESLALSADQMREKVAAGGPAAHDALGQVLDGLRNIKDPAEQSRIAVELFGTQAEDLGGALSNFDLSNAVGQLGDVQGAAQRASDTVGGTGASSWESMKRSVEVSLDTVQQKLAEAFGPSLTELTNAVTGHGNEIVGVFLDLASGATRAVGMTLQSFGELVGGIGNVYGAILRADAAMQRLVGDDKYASELDAQADAAFGWGESLKAAGGKLVTASDDMDRWSDHLAGADQKAVTLGNSIGALAQMRVPPIDVQVNAKPGGGATWGDSGTIAIPVAMALSNQAPPPGSSAPTPPGQNPLLAPYQKRAAGGMVDASGRIIGPGSGTSDSILAAVMGGDGGMIRVSNQESINTAASTRANWPVIDAMNAGANLSPWLKLLPGFAVGGMVSPDVAAAQALAGTPYSQGNRTDCSGMAARVIARALGIPESGLMTTKNAAQWLAQIGFQPGTGGPGQISVGWYDHGPGTNDGHMAMTLSDGTHAEAGGKNGVFTLGAGAAGADSPQFDQHMFLPTLFGEGQAGSLGGFSSSTGSSSGGGGTPGIGPNGESGTYSAPDAKAAREADERIADADQRVKEAEAKQRELKADVKESEKISAQAAVDKATREAADARADRDEVMKGKFTADKPGSSGSGGGSSSLSIPSSFSSFGSAIGEFAGGQIGSALDVFGIGDSPPWLQAASKLVGGISIGGGSAGPIAAAPAGTGTPVPMDDGGNVHGLRAGQAPGPVYSPTFNTNDDTAFRQWQRWQNDRVGANLDSK